MRPVLLSLVAFAFAGTAFADDEHVRNYTSTAGKFRIKAPGQPELVTEKADSAIGKLTFKMAMWIDEDDRRGMLVSYIDYPVQPEDFDADRGLDAAVEGAAANSGSAARNIEKIEFGKGKYPGRKFLFYNRKADMWVMNMIVLKDNRLYHVMVLGTREYVTGAEAKATFNSFEIVK